MTKIHGWRDVNVITHSMGSQLYAEHGGQVIELEFPDGHSECLNMEVAESIARAVSPLAAPRAPVDGQQSMPVDRMLQFFAYQHLRPDLQAISKPMHDMAVWIINYLPANPERAVALRKLLESKDCAVRAQLYKEPASDLRIGNITLMEADRHD